MVVAYKQLKSELDQELINILSYWAKYTIDEENGGFFGRIDHFNRIVQKASKGVVLNARILWTFSAASNYLATAEYTHICNRAYTYLKDYFWDKNNGGVFWEVDYTGKPVSKRKQIYAQAFAIYALAEYYSFTKIEEARNTAISIYELIETHSKDKEKGGYIEALDEKWNPLEDMRLSNKDMNAAKTMNTHLHILEAYTGLLKIYDNSQLRTSLKQLVEIFLEKFLNEQYHYELFFDKGWTLLSNTISYGHDIESAWLVLDAARLLGDRELIDRSEEAAINVAGTFLDEAIDGDGAVINEKSGNATDTDRHWWPQMEALVGLAYAHKLSGAQKYIDYSLRIWGFTKRQLLDYENGEWYFRVDKKGKVYTQEDKVSMWKAPYHTSRACILLNTI